MLFLGEICGSILPKSDSFCVIVLSGFSNSGEPMQNVKPTDLPCVSDQLSPVSAVINRIAAIAPAPLLPGEQEADTLNLHWRSSKPHIRRMRSKTF
jgi:hypothetical protein